MSFTFLNNSGGNCVAHISSSDGSACKKYIDNNPGKPQIFNCENDPSSKLDKIQCANSPLPQYLTTIVPQSEVDTLKSYGTLKNVCTGCTACDLSSLSPNTNYQQWYYELPVTYSNKPTTLATAYTYATQPPSLSKYYSALNWENTEHPYGPGTYTINPKMGFTGNKIVPACSKFDCGIGGDKGFQYDNYVTMPGVFPAISPCPSSVTSAECLKGAGADYGYPPFGCPNS